MCFDMMLLLQRYYYPDLLEAADSLDGQMTRERSAPAPGVTSFGHSEEGSGKQDFVHVPDLVFMYSRLLC